MLIWTSAIVYITGPPLLELLELLELVEELVELLLELRIPVELLLVLDEQGPTLQRVHFNTGLVCRHVPSGNTRRSGANATKPIAGKFFTVGPITH